MPRTEGRKTCNTFVAGIITEATGINFPENATVDEANFRLNRDGSRQRRLGFDREVGYVNYALTSGFGSGSNYVAVKTFFWKNTGPASAFDVLVVQYGSMLYFYNTESASGGGGR